MWQVLVDFADLQDGGHVYHTGDKFPRAGEVDPGRVAELASFNNRRGFPLIGEVADDQTETPDDTQSAEGEESTDAAPVDDQTEKPRKTKK